MLEELYEKIIASIPQEDVTRDGLVKTPSRAAKAFKFLTSGYDENVEQVANGAFFEVEGSNMVVVTNIEFYSLCEHHLLPFFGYCHVGYLPDKKVLGLSKIPIIVDVFARRLQIQESLSVQIASAIDEVTGCKGVGVMTTGKHMCSMMRGVQKQHPEMITKASLGCFNDREVWAQFIGNIKNF